MTFSAGLFFFFSFDSLLVLVFGVPVHGRSSDNERTMRNTRGGKVTALVCIQRHDLCLKSFCYRIDF